MALGAPLADSEVLIRMEAVAVGAPGYVCLVSGAMMLGDVERGGLVGLVAGEGAQPDREGFALAGIPVLGDQFRELMGGVVGPRLASATTVWMNAPVMPSAAVFGAAARMRAKLVEVPGFDEVEGTLSRGGRVGDDLVHLVHRQVVSEIQDGQVLSAGIIVTVVCEELPYPGGAELGVVLVQEAGGLLPGRGGYPCFK